ncbi:hypothetical protein FT641_18775 [Bacillus paranthracis]|uniref:hypothetical protein n=1 Tax=Bacillus paranthracis TaxID=2026186 RepID=UPI00187AA870|nr:hypothetical protein [Bacillus paranthracis]MBE7114391.1 hypothetical protein [Bacillus paranthracis]MBE7154736.1 hypothetical protein [Bacillus paranthracis]
MSKKKAIIALGAVLCTIVVSVSGLRVYAHTEKQAVIDKGKSETAYVVSKEVTSGSDKSYGDLKIDVSGKTYLVSVNKEQYNKAIEGTDISVYEYENKVVIDENRG